MSTHHHAPSELQQRCVEYFTDLQDRICARFEALDGSARFEKTPWKKPADAEMQGGGEMRVMRGDVFEKVGVNFSCVHGQFSEKFAKEIPGADENPNFWASGVSLVAHMKNPLVPAVHMNVRRIQTSKGWFGGGADLTPTFAFDEDTKSFHQHLKTACDHYRPDAYAEYKAWCDKYFFLPHRNEPRGVGGIFFDYLATDDVEADFAFVQAVGNRFLTAFAEIVERRKDMPWTEEQKEAQYVKRGRYAEFNLLYDRGTRFGLMTGGNTEAILMSLPPMAKWL